MSDTGFTCACGGSHFRRIAEGVSHRNLPDYRYSLHQCDRCALVHTEPVPSAAVYHAGDEATAARIANEASYRDFARSILDDTRRYQPRGHFLDIGCNIGILVDEAQKAGYEAWGIDLDPTAVDYGTAKGRRLVCGTLDTLEAPDGGFDVVVMNHVLEHIPDAPAVLRTIHGLLSPGGHLFLNVPNYAGLIPRVMKANWASLWPHQHIWQFTPATLRHLVETAAPFEGLAFDTSHNLEPPSTRDLKGLVKQGLIAYSVATRQADELRAVFKKKG